MPWSPITASQTVSNYDSICDVMWRRRYLHAWWSLISFQISFQISSRLSGFNNRAQFPLEGQPVAVLTRLDCQDFLFLPILVFPCHCLFPLWFKLPKQAKSNTHKICQIWYNCSSSQPSQKICLFCSYNLAYTWIIIKPNFQLIPNTFANTLLRP